MTAAGNRHRPDLTSVPVVADIVVEVVGEVVDVMVVVVVEVVDELELGGFAG